CSGSWLLLPLPAGRWSLDEAVAVRGVEVESVDPAELAHPRDPFRSERLLSLECVEDDSLQEISERDVVILGDRLEAFQDSLLHPDSRLHALHDTGGCGCGRTSCGSAHGHLLRAPWYLGTKLPSRV